MLKAQLSYKGTVDHTHTPLIYDAIDRTRHKCVSAPLLTQTQQINSYVLRMRNLSKPKFGHVTKPNLTLDVWGNLTKDLKKLLKADFTWKMWISLKNFLYNGNTKCFYYHYYILKKKKRNFDIDIFACHITSVIFKFNSLLFKI